MIAYRLLFRWTPRQLKGWRITVLRWFGAKIGEGCNVRSRCQIWAPWNLELGDYVVVADDVNLYSMATIKLGNRAIVSQGSHLCAGTHDYTTPNFQLVAKPITVGERAWLAAECFVGPGVTIGDGAVIGARSVVGKDMPAWTVCAGNPCRPLKERVITGEGNEPGAEAPGSVAPPS
ncbi:MAG: WcaF family extracellular polysaccharide biosynthesis acetyltransferase [Fimbriimonadaceae bacterium]|nr:WcaF family extracellular polysaccharide biosynthesis acetyltransferase [Fimbriimonadaceae bacterium]QYK57014.1 MAG: WcaF family extracellular polysaccharide biosynthesis acetyltransferase [Fimbriimonadaceae bacterium]